MLEKIKRARKDYKYSDTKVVEYWIEEIREGKVDIPGNYVWGAAVLEIGNFSIELNVTPLEENGEEIEAEYFICSYCMDEINNSKDWHSLGYLDYRKPKVNWFAEDWRLQLEKDMANVFVEFMERNHLDFDEVYTLERLDKAFE